MVRNEEVEWTKIKFGEHDPRHGPPHCLTVNPRRKRCPQRLGTDLRDLDDDDALPNTNGKAWLAGMLPYGRCKARDRRNRRRKIIWRPHPNER